jgi:hypothetical protein
VEILPRKNKERRKRCTGGINAAHHCKRLPYSACHHSMHLGLASFSIHHSTCWIGEEGRLVQVVDVRRLVVEAKATNLSFQFIVKVVHLLRVGGILDAALLERLRLAEN